MGARDRGRGGNTRALFVGSRVSVCHTASSVRSLPFLFFWPASLPAQHAAAHMIRSSEPPPSPKAIHLSRNTGDISPHISALPPPLPYLPAHTHTYATVLAQYRVLCCVYIFMQWSGQCGAVVCRVCVCKKDGEAARAGRLGARPHVAVILLCGGQRQRATAPGLCWAELGHAVPCQARLCCCAVLCLCELATERGGPRDGGLCAHTVGRRVVDGDESRHLQ